MRRKFLFLPGEISGASAREKSAKTGQPVAGVKIRLQSPNGGTYSPEPREIIQSSAGGAFRIPDVAPGLYNVMATISGQPVPDWMVVPENNQVTVLAGETARDAVIHVSKGVLVEVTVFATNDPAPLANVALSLGQSSAFTDARGVALLRAPPGKNWYSASKKNWPSQRNTVEIASSPASQVRIELLPPPRFSGTVRDPAGAPVAGALVSFHPGQYPSPPDYVEVMTDKDGRYEMVLKYTKEDMFWSGDICPTNSILVRSLERDLAAVQEFTEIPTNLDLVLQPGITLSGSVKDIAGAPVINATVNLGFLSGNTIASLKPRPVKVNAQGSFTFPSMPQGREYFIQEATAKGYGTAYGSLRAGDAKTNFYEFPVFVLKRADRRLAGQVLGQDGKPLAGATVRFNGQGQLQWPTAKSNSKGHFMFDAVCEGEVHLSAYWNGPPDNGGSPVFLTAGSGAGIKAQAGDTNIVIQFGSPNAAQGARGAAAAAPQLTTTGTIFDPAGAPVPGVTLQVWRAASERTAGSSGANGKYTVHWQRHTFEMGGINSALIARDVSRNLAATHDLETTTTNLDLHLQPGLTLSGSVQDVRGRPVSNARVALNMIVNKANGAFYGRGSAAVPGNNTKTNHVQLPAIVLKPANLTLAGQVVDLNNKPSPDTQVTLMAPDQPLRRAIIRTDAGGHFVINEVCEGLVDVRANARGANGAGMAVGVVQAHGGDTNVIVQLGMEYGIPSESPPANRRPRTP